MTITQADAGLYYSSLHFDNIGNLGESFPGNFLTFDKLKPGLFRADLKTISTPTWYATSLTLHNNLKYESIWPEDSLTFSFPQDNAGTPFIINGYTPNRNDLIVFPQGYRAEGVTFPGTSLFGLKADPDSIQQRAEFLEIDCVELNQEIQFLSIPQPRLLQARQNLQKILTNLNNPRTMFRSFEIQADISDQIMWGLTDILQASSRRDVTPPSWSRSLAIKKVREILEDQPDFPYSISELCKLIAVSERTLRYAFADFYDISPKHYLQAFRLNRVYRQLREADSSRRIIDIALDNGFSHPGQFASNYRKLFGETPSTTRALKG